MRDYANIITAIWSDPAFRALPAGAQRDYLMLVTQPDITGAGTLPLTERRWAGFACDTTRDDIGRNLKVLEAAAFVFVDEDTEEVLVRTFVKHDKGYNNPKRIPVILVAAKAIRSSKLRTVLWGELARLGLSDDLPPLPETSIDSLSDTQPDSHTASDRVVVTVVSTDPSTLKPQTTTQNASHSPDAARKRASPRKRIPEDFTATEAMIAWAREHTPLVGAVDTANFIDWHTSKGTTMADWTAAWRTWMRKSQTDAERGRGRASPHGPKPSTTDERVNAGLAIAEQFRREAHQLEIQA